MRGSVASVPQHSSDDPDAHIGPAKDGACDMIHRPDHIVDLESGAITTAEVRPGDAALTFNDHRFVTASKQSPPLPVLHVVAPSQCVLQPSHARHQIRLRRLQEEVVKIAHEHPSVNTPPCALTSLRQGVEEESPVIIVVKDVLASIPMRHDVVIGTRILKAKAAWHGTTLLKQGTCQ
jgi:hypothetical protein